MPPGHALSVHVLRAARCCQDCLNSHSPALLCSSIVSGAPKNAAKKHMSRPPLASPSPATWYARRYMSCVRVLRQLPTHLGTPDEVELGVFGSGLQETAPSCILTHCRRGPWCPAREHIWEHCQCRVRLLQKLSRTLPLSHAHCIAVALVLSSPRRCRASHLLHVCIVHAVVQSHKPFFSCTRCSAVHVACVLTWFCTAILTTF